MSPRRPVHAESRRQVRGPALATLDASLADASGSGRGSHACANVCLVPDETGTAVDRVWTRSPGRGSSGRSTTPQHNSADELHRHLLDAETIAAPLESVSRISRAAYAEYATLLPRGFECSTQRL